MDLKYNIFYILLAITCTASSDKRPTSRSSPAVFCSASCGRHRGAGVPPCWLLVCRRAGRYRRRHLRARRGIVAAARRQEVWRAGHVTAPEGSPLPPSLGLRSLQRATGSTGGGVMVSGADQTRRGRCEGGSAAGRSGVRTRAGLSQPSSAAEMEPQRSSLQCLEGCFVPV